jgi:hypothetical protein
VNAILYFGLGAGGVVVSAELWLMLYVDAAALQIGLYFFNRRHNVSPHEQKGSAGVAGMLISALSAPIYTASLAAVAIGRSRGFVTTPKGDASTRDTLITFRKHLLWALVFGVPLLFSFVLGHHHVSMRAWSAASLGVCLLPVAIWRFELAAQRRSERAAEPKPEPRVRPVPAPPARPERREHLRPVPDPPREPVRRERLKPVATEGWSAERERRKRHQVVRFDRRAPAAPVGELRRGAAKDHVVVRFEHSHQQPHPEPHAEWQLFGQAEA